MTRTILLIGTLDTKGAEYAFVRDLVRTRGHQVLLMDGGIAGEPPYPADISASEVAEAGGGRLAALRERADRGAALDVMARGVEAVTARLHSKGRIDGVMAMGGSGGSALGAAAMRVLPVGVPKLLLSTLASGDVGPFVGIKDVTMMYSVVDIAGLNRLSRRILANAVGALCGMLEQDAPTAADKPLVAATMFGVTTPCVTGLRERLEQAGYEVLVFHATGNGGRSMEGLIEAGFIAGVADVTTTEWCDELVGGVLSAGPTRLEAAVRAGIPQVVSCGALDMVNFWARDTVPPKFSTRTFHQHSHDVTLMRTTPEECAELGRIIAGKLNAARGPIALFLPLKGVSAIDREGQPFHSPAADQALFDALRREIRPPVELIELDLHINDPAFAGAMAEKLLALLQAAEPRFQATSSPDH
ncbi:MAG: Tm-1-like ATP-binding domain-containing protein [Verrucomicrobiales bacterium]|nr:Tm-1-like ATP-binding domain-containing protein [Verrucomicrobiales bacterium]